jgi:outer membrane protein assembly factor BamB
MAGIAPGTAWRAALILSGALSLAAALVAAPSPATAQPDATGRFAYDIPVPPRSPWPEMRRDRRNTGWSPIRARYRPGERPWHLQTGKGIFSTPVIGPNGTIYAGSADRTFYAVGPDGRVRWRFRTGGIIDSAAALGRSDPELGARTITFGSGDERLYRLRRTDRDIPRKQRMLWRFEPATPPGQSQRVNWWEGNVVIGPDGTLYAGNTGGGVYALNPDGTQRWHFPTGNAVWSAVALADDGRLFFDSLDLFIYGVNPNGEQAWRRATIGFNASSPAIGSDGTVYVGSFDSNLYALDPDTGAERWRFTTDDHVYSSPALGTRNGKTTAIYVGSTDGGLYALRPDGRLLWRYETGDPIRSSPVVGRAPNGRGQIVYVGSSNGKLYAIDARTGKRRWSYDTTPRDPVLHDRNDLNGSPALGRRGIYIGGEHGRLVFVPYEWCRRAGRGSRRCETAPGDEFPDRATRIYPVSAGGNTAQTRKPRRHPAATVVNGRLVVRRDGQTIDAAMQQAASAEGLVHAHPSFPFTAELSGDGHYIHVLPKGFLRPGSKYSLRFSGKWAGKGAPAGNTGGAGATGTGSFDDRIRIRTAPAQLKHPALTTSARRVSALRLRRLAVPMPPFLASVNQIGFDSYDWIAGTLRISKPDLKGRGKMLLWIVGSRKRGGKTVVDPQSDFAFPLVGRYRHDSVILSQRDLTLAFSFGEVPFDLIEFRGQLRRDLRMRPGASLYAQVTCAKVPNYGAFLPQTGLCNPEGKLIAAGTYLTDPYRRGSANRRPRGLRVDRMRLKRPAQASDGAAVATLSLRRGARYPARRHVVSLLLVDAKSGEPVNLDYKRSTSISKDEQGNVSAVRVEIPKGTSLPGRVRAYVIADVFPLDTRVFD